jgi:hypothetical protein
MQHEVIPSELPREPFDLSAFARRTVLAGIEAAIDDPAEMKFRIMLARECGHLSDNEARDWIARHRLQEA